MVASFESLLGFALNGVVLAGIIALAAIGLTLVYGILRLSNFAHGDLLTVGAYIAFGFNAFYDPGATVRAAGWTAAALALVVVGDAAGPKRLLRKEQWVMAGAAGILALLAFLPETGSSWLGPRFLAGAALAIVWTAAGLVALDRLVWGPLRRQGASTVSLIITSIGLALLLRNLMALVFGTGIQSYERPIRAPMELLGFRFTWIQLGTIIVAGVLVVAVHILLRYTRLGKSLRAVSDDPELARITGIDVERVTLYVWALAGALAALAGVLLALNVNVNTNLGWRMILPIFAAVILGGIGSVYGAMLGALIIAVAMEVSVAFLPDSGYRLAVGFAILIATILWRPQGLLGVNRT